MDVDVPPQPARATFKLRIPHFSAFANDEDAWSNRRSVGGFDWSIWGSIHRRGGKNFFAYYLACFNDTSDNWAVRATFRLSVKNSKRSDSEFRKTATFASWPKFNESEAVGDGEMLTVEDILQHGSGFLQNDALTVVCQLAVHPTRCPVFDGLRSVRHPTHDVTLVVDGERVYANKGLLSSFSTYFAELFYGDNPQYLNEVVIDGVDFVSWCRFFMLVYCGDAIASCHCVCIVKLIPLARRFGVQSLLIDCDEYVHNGAALDHIERLMAAEELQDVELLNATVNAFSREQLLEVALSPDLNRIDIATAEKLAAKLQQMHDQ
ncbi:TD and POZ domain-containing protein 2 [Aphelenchoides avenae]|nr:TD and POZ domain-containing protein 2 [Aphelenchus avenae]